MFNDANPLNDQLQVKLLQSICTLLSESKNLYAIRGLYRIISLSKNSIGQFAATLSDVLKNFITEVVKSEND